MTTNFYDKVAKKFGGYAYGKGHVEHLTEYPKRNIWSWARVWSME